MNTMASIVEKTPEGTIYKAARTRPLPHFDLLTLLFGVSCHNPRLQW